MPEIAMLWLLKFAYGMKTFAYYDYAQCAEQLIVLILCPPTLLPLCRWFSVANHYLKIICNCTVNIYIYMYM